MKTFKELMLEVGPMTWAVDQQVSRGKETKSQRSPQHPLEIGKTRSEFTFNNDYKPPEPVKDKPVTTTATVSPTKLASPAASTSSGNSGVSAPIKMSMAPPVTGGDAARNQAVRPKKFPAEVKPMRRLSTADTSKPSRNIPVVDTKRKPIAKDTTATANNPVIRKVSPKELVKPRVAAKVMPDVAQQTGVTSRMGKSGGTQTYSNIARGASYPKSSSGMFSKTGSAPSDTKTGLTGAARDTELARRGFKKF